MQRSSQESSCLLLDLCVLPQQACPDSRPLAQFAGLLSDTATMSRMAPVYVGEWELAWEGWGEQRPIAVIIAVRPLGAAWLDARSENCAPLARAGNYEYDASERELERTLEKYGRVNKVEYKTGARELYGGCAGVRWQRGGRPGILPV